MYVRTYVKGAEVCIYHHDNDILKMYLQFIHINTIDRFFNPKIDRTSILNSLWAELGSRPYKGVNIDREGRIGWVRAGKGRVGDTSLSIDIFIYFWFGLVWFCIFRSFMQLDRALPCPALPCRALSGLGLPFFLPMLFFLPSHPPTPFLPFSFLTRPSRS